MKTLKLIFVLLIVLLSLNTKSKAQKYCKLVDTNKIWSNYCKNSSQFMPSNSYYIRFSKDTIIRDLIYNKVMRSDDSLQNSWYKYGYIRETADKKVYYLQNKTDTIDYKIYDFNVKKGDSIYINVMKALGDKFLFKIDSIDSIKIINNYRKRYYLEGEIWIEGIGSSDGILSSGATASGLVGMKYSLLCFTENDTLKYKNPDYNFCFYKQVNKYEWAPVGAKWYYEIQPSIGCFPQCQVSYQLIESIGDTLIKDKNCRILRKINLQSNCDYETTAYTYQNSDTVFWYNKNMNKFTILYIFNSNKGDSWNILVDSCYVGVVVDSIAYKEINNKLLKVLYVTSDDPVFSNGEIIENIGHKFSMFPYENYWICKYSRTCEDDKLFGLRCYEDNIIGFYNSNIKIPCDTIYYITYSIKDKDILQNNISIYPNPFYDIVSLNISNINFNKYSYSNLIYYKIYNYIGQELFSNTINSEISLIDLTYYPAGVYFVFLKIGNTSNNFKIIKL